MISNANFGPLHTCLYTCTHVPRCAHTDITTDVNTQTQAHTLTHSLVQTQDTNIHEEKHLLPLLYFVTSLIATNPGFLG